MFNQSNQKQFLGPEENVLNKNLKPLNSKLAFLFIEWCKSSTSHGIPNIARSNNIFIRFIWIIAFFASISLCGYFLIISLFDILKNPVLVNIEVIEEIPALFPTINLCNLNPFKTEDQKVNLIFQELLAKYNLSTIKSPPSLHAKSVSRLLRTYVYNLNYTMRKMLTYSYSDYFVYCFFNSYFCSQNNFEEFYDYEYGYCYRFNPNATHYSGKSGLRNGLRLDLYVGNSTSNDLYGNKRGFVFFIQNHTNKFPFISDYGSFVTPGLETNVKIKRNTFEKLSKPYSDCINDLTVSNPDKSKLMNLMFNELNMTTYSRDVCQGLCFQFELYKNCSCLDPFLPKIFNELEICFKSKQIICQEEFSQIFYSESQSICEEQCPKECNKYEFSHEISSSDYITKWFINLAVNYSLLPNSKKVNNLSSLYDWGSFDDVKKSVLAVNFYYEYLTYTKVSETPYWSIYSILSTFGGNLGLFVGISILSCVEILEIIFQMVYTIFSHYKDPNKVINF